MILMMMKRQRSVFGGRNSNRPKKRGRVFACAALLVAGLALGAGCKNEFGVPKPNCVTDAWDTGGLTRGKLKKGRCEVKESEFHNQ